MDLTGVGAEKRAGPTAGAARYNAFLSQGSPKPIVAAVNGAAVAGGFELMLACDLAIAADHAVFGLPEVKRGLVAGAGGTLLPLRIPMPIAVELALTGDNISADRAYELGLVNRVVPATDVFPVALHMAESIAANSPGAVRITRDLLYDTRELPVSELWQRIRAVLPTVLAHPDAIEGSRAFLEKRIPRWTS
jgi:enoyl-CoA hydratase